MKKDKYKIKILSAVEARELIILPMIVMSMLSMLYHSGSKQIYHE